MQHISFCIRCRGMRIGWNRKYVFHCLLCRRWAYKSLKLCVLAAVGAVVVFGFPKPAGLHTSLDAAEVSALQVAAAPQPAAVAAVESMMARYGVDRALRERVARAVVASGLKYDLDPRLIASIMLVESSGNPFAISDADAIGIMQIHLPTWGSLAESQGINLFKLEDNIDLGAQILKDYVSRHGLWEGVARYTGWTDAPGSQEAAAAYVRKVQRIYGHTPRREEPARVVRASLN